MLRKRILDELIELTNRREEPSLISTINCIVDTYYKLVNNGFDYAKVMEEFSAKRVSLKDKRKYTPERFYNSKNKLARTRYLKWNEDTSSYERVLMDMASRQRVTFEELIFALEILSPPPYEHQKNRLNLWINDYMKILKDFKRDLSSDYNDTELILKYGIDAAKEKRREAIYIKLTTKGGGYK